MFGSTLEQAKNDSRGIILILTFGCFQVELILLEVRIYIF